MTRSIALVISIAVLLAARAEATNLVVNGDFSTFVPTNASGGGWTSANENPSHGWDNTLGNPAPHFWLNEFGNSGTDPSLTQVVTGLIVSQQYLLAGDYITGSRNSNPPGTTDSFEVVLDGNIVFASGGTPSRLLADPIPIWASFSIPFTATATSMTLLLRAEAHGSDNDMAVDNIAITAVPEPPSATILLAGIIAVTGVGRRLRRTS